VIFQRAFCSISQLLEAMPMMPGNAVSEEATQNGSSLHHTTIPSSLTTPPPEQTEKPSKENVFQTATPSYSRFSKWQKRLIVFLITFAATFSPLSSFIFFPAVNTLSMSLHVSVERINLTITSYLIVAGIAPAFTGDLADMTGRRVVYLLTLGVYCIANVGLAVQNSWTALFVLRMLQSAGGAGTYLPLLF